MSLFRDDFYSTRTSRRGYREVRRYTGRRSRPPRNRLLLIILVAVSVLAGVVITLLAVRWSGSSMAGSRPVAASVLAPYDDRGDRVVQAVEKAKPAVVSVVSTLKDGDKVKGVGLGSGVIFQKSGDKARIVTNNHVVENGTAFEIVLSDGTHKKATVVGKDVYTDLAVLETDASGIKNVAEFGDSDKLKPGETAIAIGNPLGLSFAQTTTVGVISSPLRTIPVALGQNGDVQWEMEVIQTDAAINQGNSGGALVSLEGKVIGINSMKIADTGVEGLGFAIPSNSAKPILDSLIKDRKVKRPKMGVTTEDLQSFTSGTEVLKLPDSVKTGVIVNDVSGPAKDAGLKTRDVIVELDGKTIDSTMGLRKFLFSNKKIGDKLNVTFYRSGKKTSVTLTLGELD